MERWDIIWTAEQFTSAVRSVNLTIAGLVVEVSIKPGRDFCTGITVAELCLHPLREALFSAKCAFDDQYPEGHVRHTCLLLSTGICNDSKLESFLILVESVREDDGHPWYSRTGVGCTIVKATEPGLFDAASRLMLKLI